MIGVMLMVSFVLGMMLVLRKEMISKELVLLGSLLVYVISLFVWLEVRVSGFYKESLIGVDYLVDGISVYLILLTTFLVVLCVLNSLSKGYNSEYIGLIFLVECSVIGAFSVDSLLYFYVYFESVLLPMYMLLVGYGGRLRRVRATRYLFLYTVLGSGFMILGLLVVYIDLGSLDNSVLRSYSLSEGVESLAWILLLMGFIVKVPLLPFHVWLSEAHVEASTEGSVLLAGVLLKLGTYGYLRYNIELLGRASSFYVDLIYVLCGVGLIYTSLSCLRQTDIKRVIAYGSVGHMSMTILGLTTLTVEGMVGGLYQMISHGLVSGGLFLCIGLLYKRVGFKDIYNLSGLISVVPILSVIFFILSIGNLGLPGTSAFIGEYLILLSVVKSNLSLGIFTGLGMLLTGGYTLYLYNRMFHGNVSPRISIVKDLDVCELSLLLWVVLCVLILGWVPGLIMFFV